MVNQMKKQEDRQKEDVDQNREHEITDRQTGKQRGEHRMKTTDSESYSHQYRHSEGNTLTQQPSQGIHRRNITKEKQIEEQCSNQLLREQEGIVAITTEKIKLTQTRTQRAIDAVSSKECNTSGMRQRRNSTEDSLTQRQISSRRNNWTDKQAERDKVGQADNDNANAKREGQEVRWEDTQRWSPRTNGGGKQEDIQINPPNGQKTVSRDGPRRKQLTWWDVH